MITPGTILLAPAQSPAASMAKGAAGATLSTAASSTAAASSAGGLPPALLAGLAPGSRIDGTIAGRDPWGRPLLTTARGTFSLAGLGSAPLGAQITLEVRRLAGQLEAVLVSMTPKGGAGAQETPRPVALAERWPGLAQALAALGPGGHLGGALSAGGGTLAVRLAATIAALRSGELGRLMGAETLRMLEAAGGQPLIRRLRGELDTLERLGSRDSGPWRALFVPLADGDQIRMVRFFVARRGTADDEPADDKDRDTRFIVETELGGTGPLQLDGLASAKRLALVLRTHTPLAEGWREDLRALFADAVTLTGIDGGLSFQAINPFPVAPLASLAEVQPEPDIFA